MAGEQEALGAEVAAARTARGLSVEDVSRATRVRVPTLRALEAGDLRALGAPVYARGHLRSVAHAVGADPAPWLAVYEEHVGTPAPTMPHVALGPDPVARRAEGGRLPGWLQVAAGAVLFLLVLGLVGVVSGGDEGPTDLAVEPGVSATPAGEPVVEEQPTDPAAPAPDAVAAAPQEVAVQLRVTGERSWVRVSRPDNTVLFEGTLDNGAVRDFRDAERLRVLVGDAGAVAISVNGQDLGLVGAQGEVARLEYTPQDPAGA